MVTIGSLKNDLNKFEIDKINDLTAEDVQELIEYYVFELLKGYKYGLNPPFFNKDYDKEFKTIYNECDECLKLIKETGKFNMDNIDKVYRYKLFVYMLNAYRTGFEFKMTDNNMFEIMSLKEICNSLISNMYFLRTLLRIYYFNYDNSKVTINLDSEIKQVVKFMLDCIMKGDIIIENVIDLFTDVDSIIDFNKLRLENDLKNSDGFEKKVINNTGLPKAYYQQIKNTKTYIDVKSQYISLKNDFMKLYNGNGFNELTELKQESLKETYSDTDIDYVLTNEPKYNLKDCTLILPNT